MRSPQAAPRRVRVAALLGLALACLGFGPWGPIPGGPLSGEEARPPDDWGEVTSEDRCTLEVGVEKPRTIHVECYERLDRLFMHSHRFVDWPRLFGESWVATVLREPKVRLRIGKAIFPLLATPIDGPLRRMILISRGFEDPPKGIRLFELEARPGSRPPGWP